MGTLNILKRRLVRFFSVIGFDPRKILALRHLPRLLKDKRKFKMLGGSVTHSFPILTDYTDSAGSAKGHYFHQDLLIANAIHANMPVRHIDVGSRIDGFVAHVASFRQIEVLDVRPLDKSVHTNIIFVQADMMDPNSVEGLKADSVSCLHVLEHFGLGRYGDRVDPHGHKVGFENLVAILESGGKLYVSFPIGQKDEVHFNAHRVFHPFTILDLAKDRLTLERFDYVDDKGALQLNYPLLQGAPNVIYGCGIYSFSKN